MVSDNRRQVNPESGEMFSELENSIGSSHEDSDSLNTECREGDSYRCDNHSEETSGDREGNSGRCEIVKYKLASL